MLAQERARAELTAPCAELATQFMGLPADRRLTVSDCRVLPFDDDLDFDTFAALGSPRKLPWPKVLVNYSQKYDLLCEVLETLRAQCKETEFIVNARMPSTIRMPAPMLGDDIFFVLDVEAAALYSRRSQRSVVTVTEGLIRYAMEEGANQLVIRWYNGPSDAKNRFDAVAQRLAELGFRCPGQATHQSEPVPSSVRPGLYLSQVRRFDIDAPLPALSSAELLLVTSSAELDILSHPQCRRQMVQLCQGSPGAPLRFISIGCAGLAACVLEFVHSEARSANVVVLESPAHWVQDTLDAAGIGTGGDGFRAQDVAYVLRLSREPPASHADAGASDTYRVLACDLLSRESGLAGTPRLASSLVSLLRAWQQRLQSLKLVSIENGSEWSRRIAGLVEALDVDRQLAGLQGWRASIEKSPGLHYMAARPLLDLAANAQCAQLQPLLLPCLGAGGRIGLLVVQAEPGAAESMPAHADDTDQWPVVQPLDFPTPEPDWFSRPRTERAQPLYARSEYFGRSRFYFRWNLTHEHFADA